MTAQELREFCKKEKITYKELGKLIGMTEGSINSALTQDKISKQIEASIILLKKIKELEQELKDLKDLKEILTRLTKS